MSAPQPLRVDQPLEQGFKLGQVSIDPLAGEVSGPGGREKLDPKVMDVLVLLAQCAGQVVLREDLLSQLWPNVVVTDDALSRCVYELRKQLSRAGGSEGYKTMLETLPKRGYRLNGVTMLMQPPPEGDPPIRSKRRFLAIATAIATATAAAALLFIIAGQRAAESPTSAGASMNSVAVLPFADMSARISNTYRMGSRRKSSIASHSPASCG